MLTGSGSSAGSGSGRLLDEFGDGSGLEVGLLELLELVIAGSVAARWTAFPLLSIGVWVDCKGMVRDNSVY